MFVFEAGFFGLSMDYPKYPQDFLDILDYPWIIQNIQDQNSQKKTHFYSLLGEESVVGSKYKRQKTRI